MSDHIKKTPRSLRRASAVAGLAAGAVLTGGSAISAHPAPVAPVRVDSVAYASAIAPARDTVSEYLAMRDYYRAAAVTRSRTDQAVKYLAEERAKHQALTSGKQYALDLAAAKRAAGVAGATKTVKPAKSGAAKAKAASKKAAASKTASKKASVKGAAVSKAALGLPRMGYSRANVIAIASKLKGIRYRAGGTSPGMGFDCSGYTAYVFGRMGVKLPHTSGGQYGLATKITKSQAKPGDLVFWHGRGGVYHVAIYAGHGMIWHSPYPGLRVQKVAIWGGNVSFGRLPTSLL